MRVRATGAPRAHPQGVGRGRRSVDSEIHITSFLLAKTRNSCPKRRVWPPYNLTNLDLFHNSIGAEGAIAIAEALKVNAVVTTLRLNDNNIGPEGAIAIAEALKVNAVLTELNLRLNSIGPEGAIAIAEALKVNAVLTKLDIRINRMGDAGKKAVRDAVMDRSGFELKL